MAFPLLAALALAAQSPAQEPGIRLPNGQSAVIVGPPPIDTNKESTLKRAFAKVNAPLVFDVFENPSALAEVSELPDDTNCLARLARANARRIGLAAGAYVVYRPTIGQAGGICPGQTDEQIYGWLDKLHGQNPGQFRALFSGGVNLEDLDEDGQAMFGPIMAGVGGATKGLVDGTPVNVAVNLCPRLLKDGGDVSGRVTANALVWTATHGRRPTLEKRVPDVAPFTQSSDGDLDFGAGKLLTLVDLINTAGTKYRFAGECDSRARNDLIFVKGRFTRERIIGALKMIGAGGPTVALRESMPRKELRQLISKVLRDALDGADSADPTAQYLKSVLDNPKAMDAAVLAKFGYTSDQIAAGTYVSVMAGLTVQSDIAQIRMGDGTVRTVPRTSTLGLGGS